MNINNVAETAAQAVEGLKPHPAAEIFPPMSPADFDALVADITENGQLEPIIVYDGMILDGRHRYNACRKLGIEPKTVKWNGTGTPESFAISMNLRRRHLDTSQRAMVAAAFATLKRGGDQQSAILRIAPTAASVAEMFGVSTRSVETARVVRTKGAPELIEAVLRSTMTVATAADFVDLPQERQRELAAAGKYAVKKTVKRMRRTAAARRSREAGRKLDASESKDSRDFSPALNDPDFQAESEASARDIEIGRDERIARSGTAHLVEENEKLKKQIAMQDKRIAGLTEELRSAKYRAKMWEERARAAGWKERANA